MMFCSWKHGSHTFSLKIFHDFSMTSKDHFPRLHDIAHHCTIFYFYVITSIRNIKFYQLQAIHPIYYIKLTKMYVKRKAKIQTLVLDIVILYSFDLTPKMIILRLKNSITYWWNSMTFHDHSHFPWLSRPGKSFLKFHDFPGYVWTLWKGNRRPYKK